MPHLVNANTSGAYAGPANSLEAPIRSAGGT